MIFDRSLDLQKIKCADAIGKDVLCTDGKWRRVEEIVPSHGFPWLSVVNENDPDSKSGYFVHNLVLACIVMGKPLPDKDQQAAFQRVVAAMDYNEPRNRQERRQVERKLFGRPKILHLR